MKFFDLFVFNALIICHSVRKDELKKNYLYRNIKKLYNPLVCSTGQRYRRQLLNSLLLHGP